MYRRSLAISSVRYFTLFYAKTQTFMLNMFFYIRIMVTVICQNITTIEKWVDWPLLYWPTHTHTHSHWTRKALYIRKIIYMEVFLIVFPPRFLFLSMSTLLSLARPIADNANARPNDLNVPLLYFPSIFSYVLTKPLTKCCSCRWMEYVFYIKCSYSIESHPK